MEAEAMRPKRLTNAQLAFVDALMADPRQNAAAAARKSGCSEKTAKQIAYNWLNDPKFAHVAAEVQRRRDELAKKLDVTDDEIWRGLAAIAKGDITKVVQWRTVVDDSNPDKPVSKTVVEYTPSDELHPHDLAQIRSVGVIATPYGDVVQIQLHDKGDAWKTLAKMRGLMRERVDVNATIKIETVRQSLKSKLARLAESGVPGPVPGGTE
ncbi:MAG: terminase small subunit [Desulfurellales bacterium]|nr:MAG: terminase small subunit [Desulfurellales bacterium]